MSGPSEEQIKAAQEMVQPYRKQVSDTPELLSLLYDIDLLPEQIQLTVNAVRMVAVIALFEKLTPQARAELFNNGQSEDGK